MVKILFVCTGNICRSPTAEAVAKKIVSQLGLAQQFKIASAGLQSHHVGEQADERTLIAGKKRGLIFDSCAQLFIPAMFFEYDWIIAMDKGHFNRINSIKPKQKIRARIVEIINYCQLIDSKVLDGIPDPYYGSSKDFEFVLDLLEVGVKNFIEKEVLPILKEE